VELLGTILAVVWLLGVAVMGYCTGYTLKHDDSEQTQLIRSIGDVNPIGLTLVLTVLILGWPATLAYSLTKRK
jgi:cytochrome bd-type quinol oxidase subunit 2